MRFLSLFCGIIAIIFSFGCFADPIYAFWVLIIGCVGFVAGITDYITTRRNSKHYLIRYSGIFLNAAALLLWLVFSIFFAVEVSIEIDHATSMNAAFIDGE